MTHGSLFAGIGGFDLGFERAGIKTVWQVEIDPYCRAVLARHFPEAERFEDVRTVGASNLGQVDIIAGGFPCQDISNAGKRVGIDGERSGLWGEMFRIICELRPRFVVVENVSALLGRGMERVLGDLAAGGFDAEWECLPAAAFGAPHRRDRVFIVAYANAGGFGWPNAANEIYRPAVFGGRSPCNVARSSSASLADSDQSRLPLRSSPGTNGADAKNEQAGIRFSQPRAISHATDDATNGKGIRRHDASWTWRTEPDVGRVAYGIPARVDRLKGLGNAVVPQIAEWIGRRIIEAEERCR